MDKVEVEARPWIYVRYRTSMNSDEIGRLVGEAFQKLGQFIGQHGIAPAGPPLSVYYDYANDGMTMDVGFPVGPEGIAKASGDIMAGETPSGAAMKVIHKGPYDKLRDTYAEIERRFEDEGIPMSAKSWEVYVSDPDSTPPDDLLTEIYMGIA